MTFTRLALALALVGLLLPGCGLFGGACVHGGGQFFNCNDDTQSECLEVWCPGDSYCGYFAGSTCTSLGFPDESSQPSFVEPRPADDGFGSPNGGGDGATGGGSGASGQGACATYSDALGRSVCSPDVSASGCSGKYLGDGTTCSGFSCTSSGDPQSCSVPGGTGTGGGGGGSQCGTAWSCAYDGQASPMCQAACAYSGQQRSFTCTQLVTLVGASTASSCCSPYCP